MEYQELDSLFRDLLASNRGPGYGVAVLSAAPDLSVIDVELRFLSGRSYCCAEPGCHLPRNNARLVRLGAERSMHLPRTLTVRWHCRVEQGVVLKSSGVVTEGYDFEEVRSGGVPD